MRNLTWVALPLVGAALLFGAACSGDDGDAEDDADSTATSASDGTSTAGAATESGGSSDVDLGALGEQFGSAKFNVVYTITAPGMDGEWHWIQDPAGPRSRIEITQGGTVFTIIVTPEQTLMCQEGACFALDAVAGMIPDLGAQIEDIGTEASTGSVEDAGSREIAGQDTDCYAFSGTEGGAQGTGTVCVTDDGVPLFMETTTTEGGFSLQATSYSTDVSDADFEAPFPVQELPGGIVMPTMPSTP